MAMCSQSHSVLAVEVLARVLALGMVSHLLCEFSLFLLVVANDLREVFVQSFVVLRRLRALETSIVSSLKCLATSVSPLSVLRTSLSCGPDRSCETDSLIRLADADIRHALLVDARRISRLLVTHTRDGLSVQSL